MAFAWTTAGTAGLAAVAIAVGPAAVVSAATPGASASTVVALWHLDETSGNVMHDSSGFGNDGTISSDVVLGVPGKIGTAYEFTGANPIVRVPSADNLNPYSGSMTISAYLKVPSNLTTGDYNVLEKGTATASGGAYKLEINGRQGTKFGFPDCAFNSPGSLKNRVYGPKAINDGAWHQVECHLTDTQAYVTVDGVSGPKAKRVVGSIANTVALTLGGKPNNTHYFSGDVDEVSITISGGTPQVSAPVVTVGNASSVTSTSATLHGTINPGNADTTYYFTYTPAGGSTSSTPTDTIPAGSSDVSVKADITGLDRGTDYTFSLVASNSAGSDSAAGSFSTTSTGGVPGAVTALKVVSGPTTDKPVSVIVKWKAPTSGPAPTGYRVTVTDQATGTTSAPVVVGAGTLRAKVSGLVAGDSYTAQVTAFDDAGDGPTTTSTTSAIAR